MRIASGRRKEEREKAKVLTKRGNNERKEGERKSKMNGGCLGKGGEIGDEKQGKENENDGDRRRGGRTGRKEVEKEKGVVDRNWEKRKRGKKEKEEENEEE